MKLIRFTHNHIHHVGVIQGAAVVPVLEINARRGTRIPDDLLRIIEGTFLDQLRLADEGMSSIPLTEVRPLLPYDVPPKIWCIGLNYKSHAEDIDAVQPEEPGRL